MEQLIGLPGYDREVFARVWRRVSPGAGCPVEPAPLTLPPPPPDFCEGLGKTLRGLVDGCLADAAAYAALARRNGRGRQRLAGLSQKKTAAARRLSGAYFLESGVRYWPRPAASGQEGYFPLLRRQFFRERDLAEELSALAQGTGDVSLEGLYQSLWEDAQEAMKAIRELAEE